MNRKPDHQKFEVSFSGGWENFSSLLFLKAADPFQLHATWKGRVEDLLRKVDDRWKPRITKNMDEVL